MATVKPLRYVRVEGNTTGLSELQAGETIDKVDVGLGSVDNTSDADKPVSTAQAAAIGLKLDASHAGTGGTSHANVVAGGAAGFMSGSDKTKLDAITGTNTGDQTTITGNAGTATALSAGADRTKLDGIAAGATNYTHPANHPASIITQDASNRFVTDAEKTAWNAKQPAGSYQTLDADLTAIAALVGTSGLLKKTAADTWTLDTAAYTTNLGTVTGVTGTAPIVSSGGTTPAISINAATTSLPGSMSATDKVKLDGIASGAQVNVATNIAEGTRTTTTVPITSSTGTGATLSAATTLLAGVMVATDKVKLDAITGTNTGDQTNITGNAGTVTNGLYTTNKDASGGVPGLTLFKLNLRNAANTITSWFTTAATVARTWTMPDKDGTVAMTSDIPATPTLSGLGGQPLDADLTAIAALAGTSGLLKKTAANTWALDTAAYTTNLGTVTGVTGTAPIVSSGGTAPAISMAAATTSVDGYLTAANWNTFNGKQAALGYTPVQQGTGTNQGTNAIKIGWGTGAYASKVALTIDSTDFGFTWPMTAANVTTNANLTGHVTSVGNATTLGSFTLAQLNAAVTDADLQVALVSGTTIKTVNSTSLLGSGNVAVGDVTLTGTQTLTNKTLTGYTETVYALAGTDISVANGTIQTKTLAANTTFTESLADGQSVILGITAGAYTVTWPSTTWSKVGGSGTAPTLTSTGVNWVILWQVGGVLRGAFLGTA